MSKTIQATNPVRFHHKGKTPGFVRCQSGKDGGATEAKPGMKAESRSTVDLEAEKIEVVPLEKAGSKAWAGVASIDRGDEGLPDWVQTSMLVSGDILGLLLFAVIGRVNHGEILDVETIGTALPFMIGWWSTAFLVDGYGPGAKSGEVIKAAASAGKCWIIGVPLGLGIRGAYLGYQPPTAFVAVSMISIGIIMVGWRSLFAYAMADKGKSLDPKKQGSGNKKGNPFDFLKLLFNLTQRW